jgi:histidinol-phosphatase (PHP family)
VEVNTRGLYKKRSKDFFPGTAILKEMYKMDIPVCINSDAHKPGDTALLLEEAANAVLDAAYEEVYIFSVDGWKSIPLN